MSTKPRQNPDAFVDAEQIEAGAQNLVSKIMTYLKKLSPIKEGGKEVFKSEGKKIAEIAKEVKGKSLTIYEKGQAKIKVLLDENGNAMKILEKAKDKTSDKWESTKKTAYQLERLWDRNLTEFYEHSILEENLSTNKSDSGYQEEFEELKKIAKNYAKEKKALALRFSREIENVRNATRGDLNKLRQEIERALTVDERRELEARAIFNMSPEAKKVSEETRERAFENLKTRIIETVEAYEKLGRKEKNEGIEENMKALRKGLLDTINVGIKCSELMTNDLQRQIDENYLIDHVENNNFIAFSVENRFITDKDADHLFRYLLHLDLERKNEKESQKLGNGIKIPNGSGKSKGEKIQSVIEENPFTKAAENFIDSTSGKRCDSMTEEDRGIMARYLHKYLKECSTEEDKKNLGKEYKKLKVELFDYIHNKSLVRELFEKKKPNPKEQETKKKLARYFDIAAMFKCSDSVRNLSVKDREKVESKLSKMQDGEPKTMLKIKEPPDPSVFRNFAADELSLGKIIFYKYLKFSVILAGLSSSFNLLRGTLGHIGKGRFGKHLQKIPLFGFLFDPEARGTKKSTLVHLAVVSGALGVMKKAYGGFMPQEWARKPISESLGLTKRHQLGEELAKTKKEPKLKNLVNYTENEMDAFAFCGGSEVLAKLKGQNLSSLKSSDAELKLKEIAQEFPERSEKRIQMEKRISVSSDKRSMLFHLVEMKKVFDEFKISEKLKEQLAGKKIDTLFFSEALPYAQSEIIHNFIRKDRYEKS